MSASEPTGTSESSIPHGHGRGQLYPNLHNPPMPQPSPQYRPHGGQHPESGEDFGLHGSGRGQVYSNKLQNYPYKIDYPVPVHSPGVQHQCYHCNSSTHSHPGGNTHLQHHDMQSSYSQPRPTVPCQHYPPTFTHTHNQGIRNPAVCYQPYPQPSQPPQAQQPWLYPPYTWPRDTMQNQVMFRAPQNHHGQASVQGHYGFQSPETGATPYNGGQFPLRMMTSAEQNVSHGCISGQSQDKLRTQQGILDSGSTKAEPILIDQPNPDSMTPMLNPQPSCPEGSTVRKESRNDYTGDLVDCFEKLGIDPHVKDNRTTAHGKQTFTVGSAEIESHEKRQTESHEERQKESHEERQKESHEERQKDSHEERQKDSHEERQKESHEERQKDSHEERQKDSHEERQKESHEERQKESHEERQKDSHEKRQTESQEWHNAKASHRVMEVYNDRFLLSGLTEKMGDDTLQNYAEITSGYEVKKTEYSTDLSCVVVTLDQVLNDEDWSLCRKKIAYKKIEGKELRFSHIPLAHRICVRKKDSMIEHDSLKEYFSSRRSGNKSGSRVTEVLTTDHLVVVTFEDHSAVENVLAHGTHSISGQSFNISVYYDNVGHVQESSKVSTTRVYTKLSRHEIELLEVSGLLHTWLKELTHLDEASVDDKDKVKLKGTETDIKAVEDKIDQFKNLIVDRSIECSSAKMEYLLSLDGKAHTLAGMKEKKIQSIWFKNNGMLKVLARSKDDFKCMMSWITKHIFEIHHEVSEESQDIIEERLDVLRRRCVNDYGEGTFCLDYTPRTRSIIAVAQHEVKFQIGEELKKTFPKPIPIVNKEMQLPQHIQQFMKKYKAELISKIGKVEIIWRKDSIGLHGKTESVQYAMQELEKIKKPIHESDFLCMDMKIPLDAAMLDCFSNYVERTERCIITWQFVRHPELFGAVGRSVESVRHDPENPRHDNHQQKRETDRNEASGGHRSGNAQKKCGPSSRRNRKFKFDSPSRIAVKLIKGEIARAKADVIVNVVDKYFSIDTGAVSQSIMKLGGQELRNECKTHSQKKLSEGQYVMTGAGKLECKRVIHCHLAPRDNPKAAEMLIDLIERMLDAANKDGYTSMALPALGTGALLQYDPGVVANSMYNAVHKFEQRCPASKLKEVQFVLYPSNTDVLQAFQEVERSRDAAQMKSGGTGYQTSQGKDLLPKITIVSGELAKQKVDVIVNSTNTGLTLSMGSVSKSILLAGGELLQSECRDYLKHNSLKSGGFVVTHGGKLKCSHVYHACLPIFSKEAPALLSVMVHNILQKAALENVESIAFPAFGTGNLNYPSAEVAKIMFSTIHHFRRTVSHSLKQVLLVVYTRDTGVFMSFKSEEEKFLRHLSVPSAHGKPGNHNHNNSPGAQGNQHSIQTDPGRKLQFGPCQVVVKQGNIALETVECIVNPIHKDMDLRGGSVSKALFSVGGKLFQENTKMMGDRLSKDRVAGVQFTDQTAVLHVWRDFIESNQKQAMIACLNHANKKDYKTIAFPVLKTGTGSQVVEEMASDLYCAVRYVFKKQTIVSCITVVVYQPAHVHQFYDKAKELVARGTHDSLTMERETQRSEGCQQVCFKWCSDDPVCKKNVEEKISTLQDDGYFTETVPLPSFVNMKDVSEIGKELPVNITRLQEKHSIDVIGKGVQFLKEVKSLHQMIERKVAEHDILHADKDHSQLMRMMNYLELAAVESSVTLSTC
ncbi:protein mono-ADP-ribosyltransferase PARP14-like [Haliotis rubra]|uniref:protein mono-ADP-ribosyltransferase PARP14-like n=1 Tax=Haliotis rubra TaxID=36100 RepID=UPI001EE60017|nr:protein mono-ADP-ribosyltransferase PARP14-like [Haliotis rubra]XP_046561515.1 protein mono-ADP-ribosyltransferase PARP14-like [Haliotis rubra]